MFIRKADVLLEVDISPLTARRNEYGAAGVLMPDSPPPAEPCAFESDTPVHRAPLRCEMVSDFRRLEDLSAEWERLWNSDPQAEIFQSPGWAIAWWRAFGGHYTLCSIVVFAADQVVGIVPLVKREGAIQFLGSSEADHADIVCAEEWASEVLAAALKTLCESVTGWKECALRHLSENSRVVRHYRELPPELLASLHCIPTERYQIILRDKDSAIFDSLLGKHHTRRLRNKLQKAGQVRFRQFETRPEAATHLPDFFRHHVRRFAVTGRQSRCANPEFCRFMSALTEELGPADHLRFGALELDGRPLAWHFGFEVNGKFMLYHHTFDVDASDYTPGELLLWNLLAYARDHFITEFDFGTGDELYKNRFANSSRATFSIFIEPRRFAGRIRGSARSIQGYVQPLLGRMKQMASSRATMRAFRSLRMWARETMAGIRRADKDGVLWRFGLHFMRKLVRDVIWSKRSIEVFALDGLPSSDVEPVVSGDDSRDLEVSAARFGDLVDLAWQDPDILQLSDLPQCRKRLNSGERVYITRAKARVVAICWASSSAAAGVARGVPCSGLTPNSLSILVDECWGARKNDLASSYRHLLSVLAGEAFRLKANIVVHCGSDQPALRSELERQSFLPKFKITRYKALGRFHRESVRPHPGKRLQASQTD